MRIVHRILWTQRNALRVILCAALFTIAAGRARGQAGPGPIHPPGWQEAPADEPKGTQPTQGSHRASSMGLGSWPATPVELAEFEHDLTAGLNVRFAGWKDSSGAARRPKIAVIDFCTWEFQPIQFGAWLADHVSTALARNGEAFEIINRARLESVRWTAKKDAICRESWDAAQSVGADFYMMATLMGLDEDLGVTVNVARAVSEILHRPVYFVKSRVALSNEMEAHLGMPLDSLRPPRDSYSPEVNGVSLPTCVHCPAPPFAPGTSGGHISGSVGLRVLIMGDGTVGDVELKKSLEPSLDRQAMEAVKLWRFEPARDADGDPVSVHQYVQVTFHSN